MAADQDTFELEVSDMVSTWMDAIQLRVPGASVVIVATHIDCAPPAEVDLQCKWVQSLVERKLQRYEEDEKLSSIRPLTVWQRGRSLRVNCLEGEGIEELRRNLIQMAQSLPWWQEAIPGAILELQNTITERKRSAPWLTWDGYVAIAKECKVPDDHLKIATTFLHDNATLKFFGDFPDLSANEDSLGPLRVESDRCRLHFRSDNSGQDWGWRVVAWPDDGEGSELLSFEEAARVPGAVVLESRHPYLENCDETHLIHIPGTTALWLAFDERTCTEQGYDTLEIVQICHVSGIEDEKCLGCFSGDTGSWPSNLHRCRDCVYIDPEWIIDGLKGLIRHNRESLLDFFRAEPSLSAIEQKQWLRRVQRLASYGILHQDLVPFLWPSGVTELSKIYWVWASSREEGELWPRHVASSIDDYDRLISLLSGCDVLHKVDEIEYLAPALLAGSHHNRLDARAFARSGGGVEKMIMMPEIPDSFFTRLLVKLRRHYSHMDFCATSAALYGRGLRAQLFVTHREIPAKVPSNADSGLVGASDDTSRCVVAIRVFASTNKQMEQISYYFGELNKFFPGMCSIDNRGELSPSLRLVEMNAVSQEPIQVKMIESVCEHEHDRESPAERIKQAILDADGELREAQDVLTVATGSSHEWSADFLDCLRVVLVCMDSHMSYTYIVATATRWMKEAVDAMKTPEIAAPLTQIAADMEAGLAIEVSCDQAIAEAVDKIKALLAKLQAECGLEIDLPSMGSNSQNLRRIFVELDRNCDGRLSLAEFVPFAMMLGGEEEEEVQELFTELDSDGDGSISEAEFLAYFRKALEADEHLDHLDEEKQGLLDGLLQQWQDQREEEPPAAAAETEAVGEGASVVGGVPAKKASPELNSDGHILAHVTEELKKVIMPLQQFRAAVSAGLVIIPVICPGYVIENYGCWWPAFMPEMKRHSLFFDCRAMFEQDAAVVLAVARSDFTPDKQDMLQAALAAAARVSPADVFITNIAETSGEHSPGIRVSVRIKAARSLLPEVQVVNAALEEKSLALLPPLAIVEQQQDPLFVQRRWRNTVKPQLLSQANKFLEEWRGKAPDPGAFAAAADRIMCFRCGEEALADPHFFSRSDCELKLQIVRAEMNVKIAEANELERAPEELPHMLQQVCRHGHATGLDDILSRNVILDAVSCPCCVQHGETPPFCFNRAEILLYFSEDKLKGARAGSVQCPYCSQAGRASSVRILDIVAPEVFISYNWGVFDKATSKYSTQELVGGMREMIEQFADVVVWFDVGGGMGAGQSVNEEMQEGVRKCTVVLMFLSDAYVKSGNCMREYLHAVTHSKFLIPVLVPDRGPVYADGPSSGWTGPGNEDKNWWQHAAACSPCKDPDTGKAFSWSALAQFEPIDLRARGGGEKGSNPEMGENGEHVHDGAVLEMVKRIQSRFHRGNRIEHDVQKQYIYWRKAALLDSFSAFGPGETVVLKAEAEALFNKIDSNHDGEIDEAELQAGFPQVDDHLARLLLREGDADHNGRMSFDELWAVIQALHSDVHEIPTIPAATRINGALVPTGASLAMSAALHAQGVAPAPARELTEEAAGLAAQGLKTTGAGVAVGGVAHTVHEGWGEREQGSRRQEVVAASCTGDTEESDEKSGISEGECNETGREQALRCCAAQ